MSDRREFLRTAAAATGALTLGIPACTSDGRSLRILILGGTGFIGPHMVRYAMGRGHSVTLFNRGRTNPGLFPGVETLIGDRDGQLESLEGGVWDVVIDNSGYVPRHVRDSASLLAERASQYIFISSISAYRDFEPAGIAEDYPVGTLEDATVEEVTGQTYGPLKALCEQAVQETFSSRATVIRPGYIVGPGDRSDRWTYWPVRIAHGGEVLAPGVPEDPIQIIDGRDLAGFVVRAAENSTTGVFNAAGPVEPVPWGNMLETMRTTVGSNASFVWVPADFLRERQASLPIWNPGTGPEGGAHQVSNARAMEAGMTFRLLDVTIADTLEWWQSLDEERVAQMGAGLRMLPDLPFGPASIEQQLEVEAQLISAWRAEAGG